jgi:uncharacterized lipoprotein
MRTKKHFDGFEIERGLDMATINKRLLFALLWGLVGILSACSSDKNAEEEKVVDAGRDAGRDAEPDANTSANGCTRETLKATVDKYFEALNARDHADLPLASEVKFTENGKELQIGEGLWTTAGELKFKRSAFDTESCNSVTESTIAEEDTDSS